MNALKGRVAGELLVKLLLKGLIVDLSRFAGVLVGTLAGSHLVAGRTHAALALAHAALALAHTALALRRVSAAGR